jgi:hypothetical protein
MNYLRIASGVAFITVCACSGPAASNSSPTNQVGTKSSSGGKDSSGTPTSGGPAGTVSSGNDSSTTPPGDGTSPGDDASSTGPTSPGADGSGTSPTAGCGSSLLPVPGDPGVRGPWKVGVQTVTIGRLTVEITYPAQPGSESGKPEVTYDPSAWLPGTEATKIKVHGTLAPVGGDLFRGLPIDAAHGPYPVILNIHGTASFRVANISMLTHWASRGFVVVSADYPGLYIHDELASTAQCNLPTTGTQDVPTDVTTQITALTSPTGPIAFLAGHIDMNRLGITGHSQGACITATLTTDPHVQVVVPMAGSVAVATSSTLKGVTFVAGIDDKVITYNSPLGSIGNVVCTQGNLQQSDTGAYTASPGPPAVKKRLVGITGGGHLSVTDLCTQNSAGVDAAHEAINDGVCGVGSAVIIGLAALDDCGTVDMDTGIHDTNYASTAAFEEVLMCTDRSAAFANLKQNLSTVGDYQQAQ